MSEIPLWLLDAFIASATVAFLVMAAVMVITAIREW